MQRKAGKEQDHAICTLSHSRRADPAGCVGVGHGGAVGSGVERLRQDCPARQLPAPMPAMFVLLRPPSFCCTPLSLWLAL